MKYRNYLIILVLFFKTISYAQNTTNTTGDNSFLPNITPPSPQSYQFTEFGKNSSNEFSGKININITIYNYSAGNLNLPISLNYSGSGVKVNDISSNTGTNWTLTTGGVINRIINDGPDEALFPASRQFINYNSLITDAKENCRPLSQYYVELARHNEIYDTEIDIWAFNFSGYSGKFYFDQNFNPVYIENENEIKIEIVGTGTTNAEKIRNNNTFLITTPDGVKYFFGGNACEATNVFSGHRGVSQVANTSFYLYKIQHPINGEIIIEYQTDQPALLNYGKSYKLSSQCGPITAYSIPYYQVINSQNQINNPRFIKKIKNPLTSEEVNFNYDFYNNLDYLASLNNIEIKSNNTLLKKVNFTYLFPMNIESAWQAPFLDPTRFFLQKLEILNGTSSDHSKNEVYKFEYDDPDHMPKRLSPKQDLLGYFNNKNNQTTIPKPAYFGNINNPSFGDLNPDFNFSKKGSLTKITYPTGGFSIFEYEPMPAKKEKNKTYTSDFGGFPVPGYNSYGVYVDFLPVFKTQTVPITFYLTSENPALNHFCQASLKVTDLTDLNATPSIFSKSLGYSPTPRNYDFTFLQGHRYKIEILPNSNQSCDIETNFSVTLFDGYEPIDGFGIRLKSQRDFHNINESFSNYKRYYYKNSNAINDNLYNLNLISFNPKYSLVQNRSDACFEGYGIDIYSEAADIYSNKNSIETFDVVTTSYGGDNFENGGTEKYFYKQINENNNKIIVTYEGCAATLFGDEIYCGPPREISTGITMVRNASTTNEVTDLSQFNGKLLLERNFIKKNNGIFKNKETIYSYNLERKHLNNAISFIGRSLFDINTPLNFCPNNPNVPISALSDFLMAYYFVETFDYKLNSIKTKNYIDPVPLNENVAYFTGSEQDLTIDYELHDLNFKKITTTQTFEYGTLKGLPTKITTDTSTGETNSTVNTYVSQVNTLNGLTAPQSAAYANLFANNRVASPIEVKQFRNSDLLSKQRTVFKLDASNHALPETIQTALGVNPLEVRAIFEEYDDRGNPTLVLLKDGTKTKYIYNSNNQVVAKIENFTGNATSIPADPCQLITNLPNSLVTLYNYDTVTQLLTQITDSNCRKTTYVYDELHRLKQIIDHDGNILKEFDNNYRPN